MEGGIALAVTCVHRRGVAWEGKELILEARVVRFDDTIAAAANLALSASKQNVFRVLGLAIVSPKPWTLPSSEFASVESVKRPLARRIIARADAAIFILSGGPAGRRPSTPPVSGFALVLNNRLGTSLSQLRAGL